MLSSFHEDVKKGLLSDQKYLPSKYFYDAKGDALFQAIMQLEEYYLTRAEYEILNTNSSKIVDILESENDLSLLELGAGDGTKTQLLLGEMLSRNLDFKYVPIDISKNAIEKLSHRLKLKYPKLQMNPIVDTYEEAIKSLDAQPKLILFLGANIGNYSKAEAEVFLKQIYDAMSPGDLILIGFDLMKNPQTILNAYNDKNGVTKAFNLNLLSRINKELDANFDLLKFDHYPIYNPESGEAKSYLVSQSQQKVHLGVLNLSVSFDSGEIIFTEVSNKYRVKEIQNMGNSLGFRTVEELYDCKHYFLDILWQK